MQTKPKANSVITTAYKADEQTITFSVVGVADPIIVHLGKLSDDVKAYAPIHGLIQRGSDRAAKATAEFPHGSTDAQKAAIRAEVAVAKHAAIKVWADHVNGGGDWKMAPGVAGPKPLDPTIISAVMEAMGKDDAFVREFVARKADENKTTPHAYLAHLATAKRVAPILDRMRAASITGDADDALDGMDDEE